MNPKGVYGYHLDLRVRIVAAVKSGLAVKEVARQYLVDESTVRRYLYKDRLGTLAQLPKLTGRPPKVTAVHEVQLLSQLDEENDATLEEHADLLAAATGLRVSFKTVDRVFRKHRISYKKKRWSPGSAVRNGVSSS